MRTGSVRAGTALRFRCSEGACEFESPLSHPLWSGDLRLEALRQDRLDPYLAHACSQKSRQGTFQVGDVTTIDFASAPFSGVVALYTMNHVPIARHSVVYERVVRWLKPGGWFVANLPVSGSGDGIEDGWLGVPMFFASRPAEENIRLLREAGLDVVEATLVTDGEVEDDGSWTEGSWQWIVARRVGRPEPAVTPSLP